MKKPALLLLIVGLPTCGPAPYGRDESRPDTWHVTSTAGARWRALEAPRRGRPGFTLLSPDRTGITFANQAGDSLVLSNRILAQGGGVALGDVDGDGRADIYLCRTDGPNALYLNQGNWRFREAAAERGVAAPDRHSTGAVLFDADGDGDLDLLLLALGGPNALFLNDGTGRFKEDSTFPGRRSTAGSTTAALADVDGDGDLDLFVTNYKAYTVEDRLPPEERAFDHIVRRLPSGTEVVKPEYQQDFRLVVRPDLGGGGEAASGDGMGSGAVGLVQRADPDVLYLNDGRGGFEPVSFASARFRDEDGRPLPYAPESFGLAARFFDADGDGSPDLYIANDFQDPDEFWLNDARGNFRLAPRLALRNTSNSSMGLDAADLDGDGRTDFFVVDMLSRDTRRLKTQRPAHTAPPKAPGPIEDRAQRQRNTLFLNRGDGTFAEVAAFAGVEASDWSWSTVLLDVDLDGREDILVTTGHLWDVMDADTHLRLAARLAELDWRRGLALFPPLALPNVALRQRSDLTFEDASQAWGFALGDDFSHGMATGDLDGDGDQDVVINRLRQPAAVLRNNASAPRVAIRLRGDPPNTQGIGSKIFVTGGAVALQDREAASGGLYLSGSDPLYTFATGSARSVTIEVRWRDGRRSVLHDARPDRLYEISPALPDDPALPRAGEVAGSAATPLFEDRTAALGHSHTETPFDDFARQPLLPNSLTQLGPGATWADLDGDQSPELLLGSGRGGRLAAYRHLLGAGRFTPLKWAQALPPPPPQAGGDLTTLLTLPDGHGGTILLLGQSSYEAASPAQALAIPAVLALKLDHRGRPQGAPYTAVPGDTASVGPLALADYDGDGDLDLFAGARVLPGAYPLSPSSRLFSNDGSGRLSLDTASSAVLSHLGMVSAAVFTDLDGDGAPELVLALEWGPLKVFLNRGGRLIPAPPKEPLAQSLEPYYSRWNGLASGDLDGDGRLDLIATSWGRNIAQHADSAAPLLLYVAPLGLPPVVTPVLGRLDPRIGAVAPLGWPGRLRAAVPDIPRRFRTYAAQADADMQQILGPQAESALVLGATTFDHLVFFNRGAGGRDKSRPYTRDGRDGRDESRPYEVRPLPAEAQLAPAFAPLVADFDGDGHEDLILSQNFFPTSPDLPRYDAGRALLLRGDGRGGGGGGLTPVSGQLSGLTVYGDQRAAAFADYDGDGRLDVVITQNGAPTRLFHNQGATPGLEVRLVGPPANPHAVGAQLRLVYGSGQRGPTREVQAGSGYWAQNGALPLLGLAGQPTAVWVRWPGGQTTLTPIPPGARAVAIRRAG